jgi:hypothetical protein
MFRIIHSKLISDSWFNVSDEIEILKGYYEKPLSLKERLVKLKRLRTHGR